VREERIDLLVTDYYLRDGETGTEVIAALACEVGPPVESRVDAPREIPRSIEYPCTSDLSIISSR
jgi:hypothetical protein